MESKAKIYVAGHRGLVGSAIVRELLAQGFDNLVLKASEELNLTNQSATFEFFHREQPEYVFLAAAKVGGISANANRPGAFLYENLQIQNNVIEAGRLTAVKKLLFLGSSCIYPKGIETPLREDQILTGPLEPTNEGYAIAKIAGIKLCQFYRQEYGCNFISAIPCSLYGMNDNYNPETAHLVPSLIRKIHNAKTEGKNQIEIWGSGKPRREILFIDDCAKALVLLMQSYTESEPINIGTGEDQSVLEIAKDIAAALNVAVQIKTNPQKPDGMMRKLLAVDRIQKLGWKPNTALRDGIQLTYQHFVSTQE